MKAIKIKNIIIPEDKLLQWVLAHVEGTELINWEQSLRICETEISRHQLINSIKRSTDSVDDEF